nr:hypothetical protein [Tanacetum cinerariifolium]
KEADDKIKEGTLNLDDDTDAMIVLFGKEKGGYARGKEADDKIKEGTLNLDDDTDAMIVLFGKEKGGYARGVGSGVTYKRNNGLKTVQDSVGGFFALPKNQVVLDEEAFKCKLWHFKKSNIVALGTVYKSDRKQMLHNQALLNDCYKVSIDSSLVDAACIPDVGIMG